MRGSDFNFDFFPQVIGSNLYIETHKHGSKTCGNS